jgi:hypothetical protein
LSLAAAGECREIEFAAGRGEVHLAHAISHNSATPVKFGRPDPEGASYQSLRASPPIQHRRSDLGNHANRELIAGV